MTSSVRVDVRGQQIRVTFDDGRMNLLSHSGLDAVGGALDSIRRFLPAPGSDDRVPLVVFESGRPGIFAAGADMREMQSFDPRQAEEFSRKGQELFARLTRFPAVTAVIVDGDCFGGALDFVLAFDLRVTTSRSRFSHPGGKIGIITGFGGTSAWRRAARPSAVGPLFLGNEILDADRALETGLVHEVSDDTAGVVERVLRRTRSGMRDLAELKRLAVTEKNLSSLALVATRLHRLHDAGRPQGRNGSDGCTRDTSRSFFG